MDPSILVAACTAFLSSAVTITSAWLSARAQRTLVRELANMHAKAPNGQVTVPGQ